MRSRERARRAAAAGARGARVAFAAATLLALAGCAGAPATSAAPEATGPASGTASVPAPAPTDTATSPGTDSAPDGALTPFPTGPSTSTTPLPDDCRAILTDAVLAQLEDVPLNAPGSGGGIRPDSSRVCAWGDPDALATRLVTVIGYSPEREAHDALYALGQSGFTCYEPTGGIRCERTWTSPTLGIEQGRTLYYRDGVIVDTQFSHLAPSGYTNAIIHALWPAA